MRLWTVHPRYLDAKGLVAVWREGLLAQKVLQGHTKGYRHHPQLLRFRAHATPLLALGTYLSAIVAEAHSRSYRFDAAKIAACCCTDERLTATTEQLRYEWNHLLHKLSLRAPETYELWKTLPLPEPHPFFILIEGPVSDWERIA